jgi:acetylornithine deacetylase/succinyl-diaminopimelate desuccinylase-like protein
MHGGAFANPINGLARTIAEMHDADGRVTLEGFYDDVVPVTDAERGAWASLPFDEAAYAASLGVERLGGGEAGRGVLERLWARPTLDCNGIVGGYTAAGSKTIIPAGASAKISMRLVPRQDPERIVSALRRFVASHTPAGLASSVQVNALARPVLVAPDSPAMAAARAAVAEAFGREPVMIRAGASVPVTECIQRLLGVDPLMMGCSLPDDRVHAPNEKYAVDMFRGTAVAAAALMNNLASAAKAAPGGSGP